MHLKENLLNFLYDKDYFISIYENYVHVFNYQELVSLKENKIILKMLKFNLVIEGSNLFITKMLKNELLIKGEVIKVGKEYV